MNRTPRFALLAAALGLGAASSSGAEPRVLLTGHVTRPIRGAAKLERLPAGENVDLSLIVRLDQAAMDRETARLGGIAGPTGKRFLTSAEFAAEFGLARKRQALKDFASAAGLSVDAAEDRPASLVVKVSGAAAAVENAFGVQLNRYRAADGQVFRGHETEPSIPAALAPHLNAVLGLSNYRGARPHWAYGPGAARARKPLRPGSRRARRPALSGATGPAGGLAPGDIKSIYGLTLPLNGSGQTLALLELDGYNPSDITLYETSVGLPTSTPVTFKSVDSQPNLCGDNQNLPCDANTLNGEQYGGMTEVTLDIDMMLALSSGAANILVYTPPASNTLDGYARIASDDLATVASTSWGEDEADLGAAAQTSESLVFFQMAVQGQAIFSAAGDNGPFDNAVDFTRVADDPASQPYVTGVGGTSLSGTLGGAITETVWNDGCVDAGDNSVSCSDPSAASVEAGGGGVSQKFPLPSYQGAVNTLASASFRNVPDVALNADPNEAAYATCVAGSCGSPIGGTSAAAPLWAAFAALINQARAANGAGVLGFINPYVYQIGEGSSYAGDFNDITSGFNGLASGQPYTAGPGYDNASGWGSFRADALIGALDGAGVPAPPASPAFSSVSTGSIVFGWGLGSNPVGLIYSAQASLSSGFGPGVLTDTVTALSADFGGLSADTSWYFQVRAVGGSDLAAVVQATLPRPPLAPAGPFVALGTTTVTLAWTNNGDQADTQYAADLSLSAGFSSGALSSLVRATAATFSGLPPNTSYYAQVAAVSRAGALTAEVPLGAGSTLADPPRPAAAPFASVAYTSAAVAWTALPFSPSSAAAEGYLVQFSTAQNFSAVFASSEVAAGSASAIVTGLNYATTYYARVGSQSWQGAANFLALGSTETLEPPLSSGTVTGAGLALAVASPFPDVTAIDVFVPPGAFPAGTPVSAVANFNPPPPSSTNEASAITPLGSFVGFTLYAGGSQPAAPVRVIMTYEPALIPAGQNEPHLQLWRYDATVSQWTLVPSQDDSTTHVLTAYTPHFSLFAPFFVAAGADVSSVQMFPQPWEIGDPSSQYWSSALTFSGLPSGAAVKILTITGELVWSGSANGAGVLTWDGSTHFGRGASSGTYYAVFQSGGRTKTRRVVLIR